MLTRKNLSFVTLLALAAAAPGLAAADHRRDGAWLQLGEVGTHSHDADDYLPIAPTSRLARIQLRAEDGPVAIDAVRFQFADGRIERAEIGRRLRPGESVTIELPRRSDPIKMLVLDYGNRGPYWRARETAHVEVRGVMVDRREDRRRPRAFDGGGYRIVDDGPARDGGYRVIVGATASGYIRTLP